MSTAILPKAKVLCSGYITEMEVSEIMAWIKRRLKEKGMASARASMLAVGHADAIRNIKRGRGRPKAETLSRLAEVLGDPPPGLFYGGAPATPAKPALPSLDDLEADLQRARREVERLEITISTLKERQQKTG